jgi:hypothetical protein
MQTTTTIKGIMLKALRMIQFYLTECVASQKANPNKKDRNVPKLSQIEVAVPK